MVDDVTTPKITSFPPFAAGDMSVLLRGGEISVTVLGWGKIFGRVTAVKVRFVLLLASSISRSRTDVARVVVVVVVIVVGMWCRLEV